MAAVNVSELSDKELRSKLKEFKQNVGPITKSTRGIMEKKLKKYLEESQNEPAPKSTTKPTRRKSTGRKSTIPVATAPAVAFTASSNNVSQNTPPAATGSKSRSRKSTNYSGESTKKLAMFSSDEEDEGKNISTAAALTRSIQTSPIGFPSPEVVLKKISSSSNSNKKTDISRPSRQSTIRYTAASNMTKISTAEYEDDPEPPILSSHIAISKTVRRSDFSDDDQTDSRDNFRVTGNSKNSSTISYSPASSNRTNNARYTKTSILSSSNVDKEENPSSFRPYSLSSNTNKLSENVRRSSPSRLNENFDKKIQDEINASIKKMRKSFSSKKPSPVKLYDEYNQVDKKKEKESDDEEEEEGEEDDDDDDEEELDAEFVSSFSLSGMLKNKWTYVVLLIVLLSSVFAAWLYLYDHRPDLPRIEGADAKMKEISAAVNCLFQYLSTKAGNFECGYGDTKLVPIKELHEHECGLKDKVFEHTSKYKDYFLYAINGTMIGSKIAMKSLMCRVSTAVSVILTRIAILIAVIVGVLGIYYFLKRRWMVDDEETRQMLYYVDKILDTLRRHHSVCITNKDIPPYLPIPHVRDMLIPLSSRKKMSKIWQKAVQFLNSSDSRVRVETQRIAGEDFEVWRWIGVVTPKMKKEKRDTKSQHLVYEHSKSWQGPAFDEIEKVVRMPIVPPTPCLKIRYMHEGPDEKEENWVTKVQNAVLEKCQNDGAEILHIFVDKTSKEGCVYVKCDSLDSAGKSFRAMYGNWFDGRLIIVKFVTLARYHQRFPDSLRISVPLKHVTGCNESSSLTW